MTSTLHRALYRQHRDHQRFQSRFNSFIQESAPLKAAFFDALQSLPREEAAAKIQLEKDERRLLDDMLAEPDQTMPPFLQNVVVSKLDHEERHVYKQLVDGFRRTRRLHKEKKLLMDYNRFLTSSM